MIYDLDNLLYYYNFNILFCKWGWENM